MALAAGLMVVSLVTAALAMDRDALGRETRLVQQGLVGWVQEVDRSLATEAVWDEAVAHLDNRFDRAWTHANIGVFLYSTGGFSRSFVLGPDNAPEYASVHGVDVSPSSFSDLAPLAAPLVEKVRAAEAARRAASETDWPRLLKTPAQESAFLSDRGGLELVTATLVQPDFGHVQPRFDRAPILVTTYPVDAAFVRALAGRFALDSLRLTAPDAATGPAETPLPDASGHVLARLAWSPERPGSMMLRQSLPWLILLAGLMALAAAAMLRRVNEAARGLLASEARATHLALHDELTGLANRRLFSERLTLSLAQARRGGRPLAVVCLDLDRFKEVNDSFGHQAGDELVQVVGHTLQALCRAGDTLARLGGDEFAVLIPGASASDVAAFCERIIAALKTPLSIAGSQIHASCSMGVAVSTDAAASASELIRQADLALYRAKDLGRGRHCLFQPEMDAALKHRRSLETDLRAALRGDQLALHYQPQVDGRGRMTGVEALLRWRHPERGEVSPALFVPIAEECGLIGELGRYALRQAFRDKAKWPDLTVAVNISARQLRAPGFPAEVAQILAESGARAHGFELEITEGILLDDDDQTQSVLRQLKAMGFSLALDDFGTGYSSLSYLRRYPIDRIKIDRSFITSLGADAEAEVVVSAIVKLARALNLEVIAEGVETHAQRDRLLEVGCAEVQGFLFSPPVPAGQIEAMADDLAGRSRRHAAA